MLLRIPSVSIAVTLLLYSSPGHSGFLYHSASTCVVDNMNAEEDEVVQSIGTYSNVSTAENAGLECHFQTTDSTLDWHTLVDLTLWVRDGSDEPGFETTAIFGRLFSWDGWEQCDSETTAAGVADRTITLTVGTCDNDPDSPAVLLVTLPEQDLDDEVSRLIMYRVQWF